jgi:hypothetical protein
MPWSVEAKMDNSAVTGRVSTVLEPKKGRQQDFTRRSRCTGGATSTTRTVMRGTHMPRLALAMTLALVVPAAAQAVALQPLPSSG